MRSIGAYKSVKPQTPILGSSKMLSSFFRIYKLTKKGEK